MPAQCEMSMADYYSGRFAGDFEGGTRRADAIPRDFA